MQLTIYNSEDLTLVREIRTLTFRKGLNGLQFSWANTLIDPSSVELRFLEHAEKLSLLDTTFPHDRPQSLSWNVMSDFDGAARVEITYFTSGIGWSADYVLTSGAAEESLALKGYVRVTNNSGEDYADAQIRLVVGTINLVEKIAALAMQGGVGYEDKEKSNMARARRNVAMGAIRQSSPMEMQEMMSLEVALDAKPAPSAKEIEKEGLSEYFIFSVPGTETIPNGWSKRMVSVDSEEVPFKVEYRYRPMQYGDRLVRMYVFTNDADSKLGEAPLPDGIVRVFRDNGRGGLSYIATDSTKYIPVGDKAEINLGVDPEVVFELVKLRAYRDNVWMQFHGADIYRRIDAAGVAVEVDARLVGWDDNAVYTQRIRNYTSKPIQVEVRRTFTGDVEFKSQLEGVKLYDFRTPQFSVTVPAGKREDCLFHIVNHQEYNLKQSHVVLVDSKVELP